MIAQGILAPESATEFGVLKPTGGEVCINCKASLSRKDALTRHLRRRDKSECLAAYMKARKWPLNTGTDADDNEE
ncbi:hypothetical protein FRC12_023664 [Ceratobasidium sp. 428]|nr:hypothetical protein FRC12_023664 [Ceratobasidium sp. 428]